MNVIVDTTTLRKISQSIGVQGDKLGSGLLLIDFFRRFIVGYEHVAWLLNPAHVEWNLEALNAIKVLLPLVKGKGVLTLPERFLCHC